MEKQSDVDVCSESIDQRQRITTNSCHMWSFNFGTQSYVEAMGQQGCVSLRNHIAAAMHGKNLSMMMGRNIDKQFADPHCS